LKGKGVRITFWQRLTSGVLRVRQRPDWAGLAGPDWPERIMHIAVTDDFHAKQGRSTGRLVLEANGQRLAVYLKRHYQLGWWRGLLALVRPGASWSPALQEWDQLEWARGEGLPVPEPVAAGQYVGPWGRLQSFLAVAELTGMIPLHKAIPAAAERLDAKAFVMWKRGLAAELARLVGQLHARRRFHKDLYLCHFFVDEVDTRRVPDWQGRVSLIDLHRLGHHPLAAAWWRAKDLAQLLYSSDIPGLTWDDRLHFWHVYSEGSSGGLNSCFVRWAVRVRAWAYSRRHARRERRHKMAEAA
jgi:heptose I phosphotransferase